MGRLTPKWEARAWKDARVSLKEKAPHMFQTCGTLPKAEYAGERTVGLQNNDELDASVFEPPGNQHRLPAPRVEPIVDPSFDQVFVGSMSPFRARAGQPAGCR